MELVEGEAERTGAGRVGEVGEAWSEDPAVDAGEKQGGGEAAVGESVAVSVRNPFDESVEAESAEVVGHPPRAEVVGGEAKEGGEMRSEVAVGEPVG
jgi:hypothetical protein